MNKRWLAMVSGSGILLMLIAVYGITTAREATQIYSEVSSTNAVIQDLELQLERLRSELFLAGVYVRDQLLDSRSDQADDRRDRLREVRESMEHRLQEIAKLVPEQQASSNDELRREVSGYWESVTATMENPAANTAGGYTTLRGQMVIHRESALAIAREIRELNEKLFKERQSRLDAAQRRFVAYIWAMMASALAVGILVSAGSAYTVYVLDRRAEAHREQTERTGHELRRLSSQLLHAQEQERRVLSRELHDQVGQTLTGLGMELANLEQLRGGASDEFGNHLDEAKRLTQDTMRTVRELAMGLRPAMLDDSGLAPAVRYQAREFSRRHGIPVTVQVDGNLEPLADAHKTCIYRVVQEALTNCARHAKAENIQVALQRAPDAVSLAVQDDGIGFQYRSLSGMGLVGIEERVRELGGNVHIDSKPNRGTLLRVNLPLQGQT